MVFLILSLYQIQNFGIVQLALGILKYGVKTMKGMRRLYFWSLIVTNCGFVLVLGALIVLKGPVSERWELLLEGLAWAGLTMIFIGMGMGLIATRGGSIDPYSDNYEVGDH